MLFTPKSSCWKQLLSLDVCSEKNLNIEKWAKGRCFLHPSYSGSSILQLTQKETCDCEGHWCLHWMLMERELWQEFQWLHKLLWFINLTPNPYAVLYNNHTYVRVKNLHQKVEICFLKMIFHRAEWIMLRREFWWFTSHNAVIVPSLSVYTLLT